MVECPEMRLVLFWWSKIACVFTLLVKRAGERARGRTEGSFEKFILFCCYCYCCCHCFSFLVWRILAQVRFHFVVLYVWDDGENDDEERNYDGFCNEREGLLLQCARFVCAFRARVSVRLDLGSARLSSVKFSLAWENKRAHCEAVVWQRPQ